MVTTRAWTSTAPASTPRPAPTARSSVNAPSFWMVRMRKKKPVTIATTT